MIERIPLIEPVVGQEELENVEDVLNSGYLTQGPYAEEFEEGFRNLVGTDHAVTTTSCTTGLEMVLEAHEIGPDHEVIIPDFTHPATGNAVVRVGSDPVLVDVDRQTYNIDPDAIMSAITDRTEAIMPVSWGGQPLNPDPILDIATEEDLIVIEDAACSAGASYNGVPVGSQFDASVFSFHPRKVLTTGEGGIVTTDNSDIVDEMRQIKNFGTLPSRGDVGFVRSNATNYRLSDILAAVGVAQLKKADMIINRRRELAERYTDLLRSVEGVVPPVEPGPACHTYQSYCVYIENGDRDIRDEVIETLSEDGIETQIGTYALHKLPAFESLDRVGDLHTSEQLFNRLLTLPVAHSLTEEDQVYVVECLDDALETYSR